MAEFCLECFNEVFEKDLTEEYVSFADSLCEGCGKSKPCVIRVYDYPKNDFKFSNIFKLFKRK